MLVILAPGTVVIQATQAGDTNYQAATPVNQTLTINKAPQALSLSIDEPIASPQGTFFTVDASGSSGLIPTFTTSGTAILRVSSFPNTSPGNGFVSFTVSGYSFRANDQGGFFPSAIQMLFDGGNNGWIMDGGLYNSSGIYTGSSRTISTSGVTYAGERVDFEPPAPIRIVSVTLTSPTTGSFPRVCHVLGTSSSGSTYTFIQTFTFDAVTSGTLTFTNPPRYKSFRFIFQQTGTGTLMIREMSFSFSPFQTIYEIVQPGSITVTATQAGDAIYASAIPVSQSITFTKALQTLALTLSTNGSTFVPNGTFVTVDASMNSALTPTFSTSGTAILSARTLSLPLTASTPNTTVASVSGFIYRASSITSLSDANYGVSAVFDGSGSTFWSSATERYNTITRHPTGAAATTTSIYGKQYQGEWIEVECPTPLKITSLSLTSPSASTFPRIAYIMGSPTGASGSYEQIRYFAYTNDSTVSSATISMLNTAPFKVYRVIVREVGSGNASVDSSGTLQFTALSFTFSSQQALYEIIQAGSTVITATQSGTSFYDPVTTTSSILTINKANQTISFALSSSGIIYSPSGTIITLSGSSTSSLPLIYTVTSGSSIASISGSTLYVTGAGTVTIQASQTGDANYQPATPVSQTLTITRATQTISFTLDPATTTYSPSGTIINLSGSASSSLSVTYTVTSGSSIASVSGSILYITGVGLVTIQASQVGNNNYQSAPAVSQTLTVSKAPQAISFILEVPTITLNSRGTGVNLSGSSTSDLTVTYTVTSGSEIGTISGSVLTILKPGKVTITAAQAGNTYYDPATEVTRVLTILAPQTIDLLFSTTSPYLSNTLVTISGYAWSAISPMTFVSSDQSAVTISGYTIPVPTLWESNTSSLLGSCTASVNVSTAYMAFDASGGYQTTSIYDGLSGAYTGSTVTHTRDGSNIPGEWCQLYTKQPFSTLSAVSIVSASSVQMSEVLVSSTGASGSWVRWQSSMVGFFYLRVVITSIVPESGTSVSYRIALTDATLQGYTFYTDIAGSATLYYSNPGDDYYGSVSGSILIEINKLPQSISFALDADTITYDPTNLLILLSASATSGLPVSYTTSGSMLATVTSSGLYILQPGVITITATQSGNVDYATAPPVSQTLTIMKIPQTLSFELAESFITYDLSGTVVALSASATSGLTPVFRTPSGSTNANVSGTSLIVNRPGIVTITCEQEGNVFYDSATPVSRVLSIDKVSQTVLFSLPYPIITYNPSGTVINVSGSATSGLIPTLSTSSGGIATVSGFTVTVHQPGTVMILADQSGNDFFHPAASVSQELTILKTPQTLSFSLEQSSFTFSPGLTVPLLATSTSQLIPTFTTSASGIATVSGSTLFVHTAGTFDIIADQAGDIYYTEASPVSRSMTVTMQVVETITSNFATPLEITFETTKALVQTMTFTPDTATYNEASGVQFMVNSANIGAVTQFSITARDPENNVIANFQDAPIVLDLFLPNANPDSALMVYKLNPSTGKAMSTQPSGFPVLLSYNATTDRWTGQITSLSRFGVVDATYAFQMPVYKQSRGNIGDMQGRDSYFRNQYQLSNVPIHNVYHHLTSSGTAVATAVQTVEYHASENDSTINIYTKHTTNDIDSSTDAALLSLNHTKSTHRAEVSHFTGSLLAEGGLMLSETCRLVFYAIDNTLRIEKLEFGEWISKHIL